MELGERVGRFFLFLGGALLALYLISDIAQQPEFNYLFIGLLFFLIGWGMARRYRKPPERPQRWTRVKQWRERRKKSGEEGEGEKEKSES